MRIPASLLLMCLAAPANPGPAGSSEVLRCKHVVQGRIDVLDAELHKGQKPNVAHKLVKRRDRLRTQLADCERNPNAYRKDI